MVEGTFLYSSRGKRDLCRTGLEVLTKWKFHFSVSSCHTVAFCTCLQTMLLVSALSLVKPHCEECRVGFLLRQGVFLHRCRQAVSREEVLACRESVYPFHVVVGVIPGGPVLPQHCCVLLCEILPVPSPLIDTELWLSWKLPLM